MSVSSAVWAELASAVREAIGLKLIPGTRAAQGGGCINEAWLVEAQTGVGENRTVFLKANRAEKASMFSAEAEALDEIDATGTIRVPRPLWKGVIGDSAFLMLESIAMRSRGTAESEFQRGVQLAKLHRHTEPQGRFGWHRENVIGETRQLNDWQGSWPEFYAEKRIGFQLELARQKGRNFRGVDELTTRISEFFRDYQPEPSLLHGDLWGGNAAFDEAGNPVIFDPASYYGDRETDLAFTEMFGGFGSDFYRGYESEWPLDPGYGVRKTLYNLYHVLNHDHLFGGGYAVQAQGMIDRLLGEG